MRLPQGPAVLRQLLALPPPPPRADTATVLWGNWLVFSVVCHRLLLMWTLAPGLVLFSRGSQMKGVWAKAAESARWQSDEWIVWLISLGSACLKDWDHSRRAHVRFTATMEADLLQTQNNGSLISDKSRLIISSLWFFCSLPSWGDTAVSSRFCVINVAWIYKLDDSTSRSLRAKLHVQGEKAAAGAAAMEIQKHDCSRLSAHSQYHECRMKNDDS